MKAQQVQLNQIRRFVNKHWTLKDYCYLAVLEHNGQYWKVVYLHDGKTVNVQDYEIKGGTIVVEDLSVLKHNVRLNQIRQFYSQTEGFGGSYFVVIKMMDSTCQIRYLDDGTIQRVHIFQINGSSRILEDNNAN